ncbi:hypothetical protein H8356DRAFT_1335365, partial [Neocallimastix lanati (nom. inval.)]
RQMSHDPKNTYRCITQCDKEDTTGVDTTEINPGTGIYHGRYFVLDGNLREKKGARDERSCRHISVAWVIDSNGGDKVTVAAEKLARACAVVSRPAGSTSTANRTRGRACAGRVGWDVSTGWLPPRHMHIHVFPANSNREGDDDHDACAKVRYARRGCPSRDKIVQRSVVTTSFLCENKAEDFGKPLPFPHTWTRKAWGLGGEIPGISSRYIDIYTQRYYSEGPKRAGCVDRSDNLYRDVEKLNSGLILHTQRKTERVTDRFLACNCNGSTW